MAILKQLHMKEDRTSSNPSRHLKVTISYILKADKCENGRLVGAVNCVAYPDLAYRQMMQTKREYGKLHGRQGYHYILSFTEGEISPEKALEITAKFVQEYLHGGYEAVYSVHTDRTCIHSHIVFNSVGLDGYKYHAPKGEWRHNIMPIVNKLCEEYGLSEIRLEDGEYEDAEQEKTEEELQHSTKVRGEKSKASKRKTVKSPLYGRKGSGYGSSAACLSAMLRRDIDECIGSSGSLDEFYRQLRERGYSLRVSGNRAPALKHREMERVRRFSSLGEGYSIEKIEERIRSGEKPEPESGISKDEMPKELRAALEKSGLEAFDTMEETIQKKLSREIFFCLLISREAYSRACVSTRVTYAYSDFYNLRDAYEFIHTHNIQSAADLDAMDGKYSMERKSARTALRKISRDLTKDEAMSERITLLQQYRELKDAVFLYRSGDDSFYEDFLKAQRLLDQLARYGKTFDEVERELDSMTDEIEKQKGRLAEAQEMLRKVSNVRSAMKRETTAEVMERIVRDARERDDREERRKERAKERSTGKERRI